MNAVVLIPTDTLYSLHAHSSVDSCLGQSAELAMRVLPRRGVTLIDVLATIAVVTLLGAVIAPVLRHTGSIAAADRERAAARLMSKAWSMYAGDNHDAAIPAIMHWDWVHFIHNQPVMVPTDPFVPTRRAAHSIAKPWTLFLMSYVPMETPQVQVDSSTRATFDSRPRTYYTDYATNSVNYPSDSRAAAYAYHPSVGMNGVYVGGSYGQGAFRGTPTTGPNPMSSGGRFYLTRLSDARSPSQLVVFTSAHGGDVREGAWWNYGESDPVNYSPSLNAPVRPGYFLVLPPKRHPRGRGSAGMAYTLYGGWNAANHFSADKPVNFWGMVDCRSNGAAMTAMADGHVEAQTLEQLRDMRKWSNYATGADWNFQAGP